MDIGQIPWSSIIRWADLNGITDLTEITKLNRYIRALESVEQETRKK